ncbi:MAG: glycosyltransferase [Deltaproteobacteria bacterium]|nr:glycosyltransferase [Deltaproteobacteria bacterium]
MARALRARHPALEVHVLGGGDASLLLALRRVPGVEVHGYYRAGTLPARLAHIGANVAVAPSIVPEAFQLTLSECWLAGVPCVVFDHGAAAERIRAHGGGRRVPLDAGASGLVAAIEEVLTDPASRDLGRATASVPSCAAVAGAHLALYAELGLAVSTTPADTTPSKRVDA